MKKLTKTLALSISIATSVFMFSGCAKNGTNGTSGTNGTNGKNGSSNISNSLNTIFSSDWKSLSTNYWYFVINNSKIINADSDAVIVYVQIPTSTVKAYIALPTTNLLANGDAIEYIFSVGKLTMYYNFATVPTSSLNIKTVVIPPGIKVANPNTNWKNYNEVKQVLNLQD